MIATSYDDHLTARTPEDGSGCDSCDELRLEECECEDLRDYEAMVADRADARWS